MLYNKAPGAPGPLGNQPPNYATPTMGRQAVSAIGGQPSMISPVGFPQGSPLQQPGSGYSGFGPSMGQPQSINSTPVQGGMLGQGMAGQVPSINPWTSSRNRSTLLRALVGNHTTPGAQ